MPFMVVIVVGAAAAADGVGFYDMMNHTNLIRQVHFFIVIHKDKIKTR